MSKKNYENLALSSNGFLFDAMTGNTYTLNSSGTVILQELINGHDIDSVTQTVVDKFDVNEAVIRRDILQLLQQMKKLNLIIE